MKRVITDKKEQKLLGEKGKMGKERGWKKSKGN